MKKENISIVICTYNRADMLTNALKSLIGQETDENFSFELILVNDKSTDNTREVIEGIIPLSPIPIKYIEGPGQGISKARNVGIENCTNGWIAFFDDDQIAKSDWLKELLSFAVKHDASCVGGIRSLNLSETEISNLNPIIRRILGEVYQGDEPKQCGRKEFPAAGDVLFKRSVFDTVGLFDESLLRGGEDIEFAQRFRQKKLDAWYTPKAISYHEVTPYRLSKNYLIWSSLRAGDNFAYRDYLEWGKWKTVVSCIARTGQAFFINFPLYLWTFFKKDENEKLGRECLMWRNLAYMYHTFHLVFPKIFTLEKFFAHIEFRKEREAFSSKKQTTQQEVKEKVESHTGS